MDFQLGKLEGKLILDPTSGEVVTGPSDGKQVTYIELTITRRVFLAGAAAFAGRAQSSPPHPDTLEKFVDPLPIPVIAKAAGAAQIIIVSTMTEIAVKVHRDLPATRMWGYNGSSPGL